MLYNHYMCVCIQVLVDEDSQLQKQLKPSKRQRDLEHLARTYLHDNGKNVGDTQPRIHTLCIYRYNNVCMYHSHGHLTIFAHTLTWDGNCMH